MTVEERLETALRCIANYVEKPKDFTEATAMLDVISVIASETLIDVNELKASQRCDQ